MERLALRSVLALRSMLALPSVLLALPSVLVLESPGLRRGLPLDPSAQPACHTPHAVGQKDPSTEPAHMRPSSDHATRMQSPST